LRRVGDEGGDELHDRGRIDLAAIAQPLGGAGCGEWRSDRQLVVDDGEQEHRTTEAGDLELHRAGTEQDEIRRRDTLREVGGVTDGLDASREPAAEVGTHDDARRPAGIGRDCGPDTLGDPGGIAAPEADQDAGQVSGRAARVPARGKPSPGDRSIAISG
jgi:hypothetical protein